MSGYKYRCIASGTGNCFTPDTSAEATFIMHAYPEFTQLASNAYVCGNNTSAQFSVVVVDTGVTYHWQLQNTVTHIFEYLTDNATYSGVTTSTLHITGVNNSMDGNYYNCVVFGSYGCNTGSAAHLQLDANAHITAQATSTSVCAGSDVTLSGTDGFNFIWNNAVTDGDPFAPVAAAMYTVTGVDWYGCPASDSIYIDVLSVPVATIQASESTTFCNGGSVTLSSGIADSYLWSNGATTSTINVSNAGNYSVILTNGAACNDTSSILTITVNTTPSISGTTPASRCDAGIVDLGATASAGIITWYAASTGGSSLGTGTSFTTPSISSTTTYYVDATNSGCTSTRTAVVATVNTTPAVSSITPSNRCDAGTLNLGATASAGTLNWYAASTGGSSLGTGTSFTTPSISSTKTYYVAATNSGCTSARSSVAATVNTTPTVSSTTPSSVCDAGTMNLGATATAGTLTWYAASTGGSSLGTGTSFTTPSVSSTTTYFVAATNSGCTSTRTAVAATVNKSKASLQNPVLCAGEHITIGSHTYNTSGIYTDVFTAANGCDSTVRTNLAVSDAITGSQTVGLCSGQHLTVGSNTYTSSGTYVDVLSSMVSGCDSTLTTHLTISSGISNSQTVNLCVGQHLTVGSHTYASSGTYNDIFTAAGGCDSTVTTYLTVNPEITGSQTLTLCAGDHVTVGSHTYSASGTYTDVLTAASSCDSTVTTHLTVNAVVPAASQTLTLCAGQHISVGSNTYSSSGIYRDVIKAANNCDSSVTTYLTVKQVITGSQTISLCAGQHVTVGTNTHSATGTYTDVLTASGGCQLALIFF